jgi:hypothetical protein
MKLLKLIVCKNVLSIYSIITIINIASIFFIMLDYFYNILITKKLPTQILNYEYINIFKILYTK